MAEDIYAWVPSLVGAVAMVAVVPLIVLADFLSVGGSGVGNPGKHNPGSNPEAKIDARFESLRERKRAEWRAEGYPEGLIEKGLVWAEEYAIGMAAKITDDPAFRRRIEDALYSKSLEMADRWVAGLMGFLR